MFAHSVPARPFPTRTVMNWVAPSPPRTIAGASPCATSNTASRNGANPGWPGSSIIVPPLAPVAMRTKESLVDVSPSTLMRLNERAAASARSWRSAPRATGACVATNASNVAMSGRIMPEPFAIPVTVTAPPPSCARCDRAFGTVSVVMIASAALAQLSSRRSATHVGRPATMRSTGRSSMITPVENGKTRRDSQPTSLAAAAQLALAPAIPASPVPALALPVLTRSARGNPEAKCSFATWTGAAQNRFWVNTPETDAPSASVMRSRSLRPALRIPASATPSLTPLTGNKSSGRGGFKLTAIFFRPFFEAGRPPGRAGSSQFAVTVLVFFSRSTRARIVAADLAYLPDERRRLRRRGRFRPRSGEGLFISSVLVLDIFDRGQLNFFHLLDLLRVSKFSRHERARHFQFDRFHEVPEQLECFALVFLLRVLLRVTAQMDSLAQVVERGEVLEPVVVQRREQYEALHVMHGFRRIASHLAAIGRMGLVDWPLNQRVAVHTRVAVEPPRPSQLAPELGGVHFFKARNVPLLFHALFRDVGAQEIGHHSLAQRRDLVRDVLRFED